MKQKIKFLICSTNLNILQVDIAKYYSIDDNILKETFIRLSSHFR